MAPSCRRHQLCFDDLRMRNSLVASLWHLFWRARLLSTAGWASLRPNILAILALNEKMPGSVVDIGCLNIYTKYLLKIPRHLPKIHV